MTFTEESFSRGFDKALELWRGGYTCELITHHERYDTTAFGRGMFAAVEALLDCLDLAEQEARLHGFTRDKAMMFVTEKMKEV